jgi:hypothetical protein
MSMMRSVLMTNDSLRQIEVVRGQVAVIADLLATNREDIRDAKHDEDDTM